MEDLQDENLDRNMEVNYDFELDINFITVNEHITNKVDFHLYEEIVILFLRNSDLRISENELMNRYRSKKDLSEILSTNLFIKETLPIREKDGTFTNAFIDIAESYIVEPSDAMYDFFFAYKLKHTTLLELDAFLDYHLHFYYNDDFHIYKRFLNVCMRTHQSLLKPQTELTINEWIVAKTAQLESLSNLEDAQLGKVRSKRPARTNNDHKTSLTQEQTVLLAHYLKESKVFYNGYLSDAEMGTAFEILTGYSQNKLRLTFSKVKIESIKTHENVKALDALITGLAKLIEKDLPKK